MAGEARVGTIVIGMRAGVGSLSKDLGQARGELQGFEGFASGLKVAVGAFAGLRVVQGAVGFLRDAAVAASDLNEQVSAAGATFGPDAAKITAAADDMARRFGTVKTVFYESANGLGAIFKASGFSEGAAADLAVQFTKLAGDLASFRNLRFEDALEKIKSGLVGEAEPLRSVGVLLSEAAVQQEAYATGIAAYGAKLTEAQKVQARAAIITRQLADAQGDLERTAGSTANQFKAISGRAQNFQADVGTALDAVTNRLTQGVGVALGKLVGLWDANSAGVAEWAEASVQQGGVVFEAIGMVGSGVGLVADAFQVAKVAFLGTQAAITTGIDYTVYGVSLLGKALESLVNLLPGVEVSFTGTLDAIAGDLHRLAGRQWEGVKQEIARPWPSQGVRRFFDEVRAGAQAATGAAAETTDAVRGVAGAQLKLAGDVAKLTDKLREQVATFGMTSTEADLYKLSQQGATEADLAQAKALAGQLRAMEDTADARKKMEGDAKGLIDATRTPFEKFEAEIAHARQLFDAGLIDQATLDRATTAANADLGTAPTAGAAALEAGSAEARSAVLAFQRRGQTGREPIQDVARNTERQVTAQRTTNDLLGRLLDRVAAAAGGLAADLIPAA